jgi:hypothetical protein
MTDATSSTAQGDSGVIEDGSPTTGLIPFRVCHDGLDLLADRLRRANRDDPDFETRWRRLRSLLEEVLDRVAHRVGARVELVAAAGEWAQHGIDLRNLPYFEEIVLRIVVHSAERSVGLATELAEAVFADLADDDVFLQFEVMPLPEWRRLEAVAGATGRTEALGVPLLVRA